MFVFVSLLLTAVYACAPTSQLTSTQQFPLPPATTRKPRGGRIKEQMTYCLADRLSVRASKETYLFVSTLTLPTCALSEETQCSTMTQDRQCILIQPYIHLCLPQTWIKWQPASLCCCMAPVLLNPAAALASSGLYAVGVRGVTMHLFYSCGFMSASQRTGRRAHERNT